MTPTCPPTCGSGFWLLVAGEVFRDPFILAGLAFLVVALMGIAWLKRRA